jgi:hypothetical protein
MKGLVERIKGDFACSYRYESVVGKTVCEENPEIRSLIGGLGRSNAVGRKKIVKPGVNQITEV